MRLRKSNEIAQETYRVASQLEDRRHSESAPCPREEPQRGQGTEPGCIAG